MPTPRPAKPHQAVEVGRVVYLRYPHPRDREAFVALRAASREFLTPWEPRPPEGFDAFGHDQFDYVYKSRRQPAQERLLIFTLAGDVLVGQASLGMISRGPLQSAYMGYWIGAAHAGCGYMTEAVGLMLRHAFGRVKLHRVEANIQPHNAPSRAVAQKNGFRLEGFSPRYLRIDGEWADHERWALTEEDWRGRSR
ncbi:MAG: GNAT family N-acetyltransferase [Planctomycetota bacterium]|nr:MAG: GNAT family N-acetyltransferase [Planctomycetota bacterium]